MKKLLEILKLSGRNIFRHPLKSVFTAFLIVLASNLYFTTASLSRNTSVRWRDFFSSTFLGDYHVTVVKGTDRDYTFPVFRQPRVFLNPELIRFLEEKDIPYAPRIKQGAAVYNHDRGEFEGSLACLVGMDYQHEVEYLANLTIIEGRYDPNLKNGVLVWYEYAESLGWELGDVITLWVKDIYRDAYPYSFEITGIINQVEGSVTEGIGFWGVYPIVLAKYDYLRFVTSIEEKEAETDRVLYTELAVWDEEEKFAKEFRRLSEKHEHQFFYAERGFGSLYGIVEAMEFVGNFIQVFILIIIFISTFNMNLLSFFERKKEIGTMLAIGARTAWVGTLLFSEVVVFTIVVFIGSILVYGAACLGLSGGVDFGTLSIFFSDHRFYPQLVPASILPSFAVILATMLSSMAYPLFLSLRLDPVEIFREGNV